MIKGSRCWSFVDHPLYPRKSHAPATRQVCELRTGAEQRGGVSVGPTRGTRRSMGNLEIPVNSVTLRWSQKQVLRFGAHFWAFWRLMAWCCGFGDGLGPWLVRSIEIFRYSVQGWFWFRIDICWGWTSCPGGDIGTHVLVIFPSSFNDCRHGRWGFSTAAMAGVSSFSRTNFG